MLLFYSSRGALPLGKISDRLQVHRASVTNVVDKLAERGYVERVRHATDRRAVLARMTAQGGRVAQASSAALNGAGFAMAPLSARECEALTELLTPVRVAAGDFAEGQEG